MASPFSAARLRRGGSFIRLTGVHPEVFDRRVKTLRSPWAANQAKRVRSGRPLDTGRLEDHPIVMLVYDRCYITQAFLGYFYRVDKRAICRAIKRIEALAKPLFGVKRDPNLSREEASALIADCTEQPIQRPGDDATHKDHYSGKKKRHTLKTEYLITKGMRIAAISPSRPGSRHDLTIRRAGPRVRKRTRLYGDSACQGCDKEHPTIDDPYKKPKNGELSAEDKAYNTGLSRLRVTVEHRIGRAKRFRIVSERYRNPRPTHATKTSIVAGLVNMNAGFAAC